ncbi:MAG TPA: hypothetical protein VH081_01325 [Solirubrobacteraceae bacterium]|jgi:hypothetical protein|nr:hypothetical protein [Solirubrobacteraceae bacterium]
MELDHHALADLLRLRATLMHATLLAEDRSEQGRHVALIALDGAIEYAMWVSAEHLGVSGGDRVGFHEVRNKLRSELGSRWQQPGRRGVMQMHAARNQAQHGGAAPDPGQMVSWIRESDAFARSLVQAAFEVELEDVLLASAIEEKSLREQITAGELAINAGNAARGLEHAYEAFADARRRWRLQQEDAYGHMALHTTIDSDPRRLDSGERSADYADVSVFTSDLGEYHWLLATRRLVAEGMPPSVADARRALQFAYHWILRWQAFDPRYPAQRWREHFEELSPPSVGDGQTVEILRIEVIGEEMIGADELQRIVIQLANIPEQGRGDWGVDMIPALEAATAKAGIPEAKFIPGQRTYTGQFVFLVDRSLSAEQIASCLSFALEEATNLYKARHERSGERELEARAHAIAFAELFTVHDQFFGDIHTSRVLRPGGEVIVIAVEYLGSLYELGEIAAILRSRGNRLANVSDADGRLVLDAHEMDEQNRAALQSALLAAVEQVQQRRAFNDDREHRRQELERALQSRLGGHSLPAVEGTAADEDPVRTSRSPHRILPRIRDSDQPLTPADVGGPPRSPVSAMGAEGRSELDRSSCVRTGP